jgi:hypothetical protein
MSSTLNAVQQAVDDILKVAAGRAYRARGGEDVVFQILDALRDEMDPRNAYEG